jgi:hypothetical protein
MTLGRGKASQLASFSHKFSVFKDLIDWQLVCFVGEQLPPIADATLSCLSGVSVPIPRVLSKVAVDMFFLGCTPSLGKLGFAWSFPPQPVVYRHDMNDYRKRRLHCKQST